MSVTNSISKSAVVGDARPPTSTMSKLIVPVTAAASAGIVAVQTSSPDFAAAKGRSTTAPPSIE